MIYSLFGFNVESDYRFRTPMAEADGPSDLRFVCIRSNGQRALDESDCLYASDYKNRHGESAVQLYRNGKSEIMRFPRIADFVVASDSITCELVSSEVEYMVEICLLGHVFGYFLERSGISPIHGTSLGFDGRAALFVADRTGGKSTLGAFFMREGSTLVADDISPLEIRGGRLVCRRGYPQVKLTPEQTRMFAGSTEGYEKIHPAFEKLGVPVDAIGSYSKSPAEVAGIYLLERNSRTEGPVRITDIPPGEALVELIGHSFIAEIVEATDLRAARMKRLAEFVRHVPVKRLHYPSGYEHLPEVRDAVLRDLS